MRIAVADAEKIRTNLERFGQGKKINRIEQIGFTLSVPAVKNGDILGERQTGVRVVPETGHPEISQEHV